MSVTEERTAAHGRADANAVKRTITVKIRRYDPESGVAAHWQDYQVDLEPHRSVLEAILQVKAEQDGRDVILVRPYTETDDIAGFQAGATKADPGIKTLNGYSQDFVDQSKCKELALNQISQGSGIVFQVAGQCGLGALDAAKEKNLQGIGVDVDQAYLGDQVMTSAVKKIDQAVLATVKSVQDDSFKGNTDHTFDLSTGGVGLGKLQGPATAYASQVAKIEAQIKDGSITVPDTVK